MTPSFRLNVNSVTEEEVLLVKVNLDFGQG